MLDTDCVPHWVDPDDEITTKYDRYTCNKCEVFGCDDDCETCVTRVFVKLPEAFHAAR
jgi:hypothetical protein